MRRDWREVEVEVEGSKGGGSWKDSALRDAGLFTRGTDKTGVGRELRRETDEALRRVRVDAGGPKPEATW